MKIKSYYSRTGEDAMAAARQEMGPDAMLVNSRKTPPEARHLGEYEVVFGVVGAAGPQIHPPAVYEGTAARAAMPEVVAVRNGTQRSCCAAPEGGSRTSSDVAGSSPSADTRGCS